MAAKHKILPPIQTLGRDVLEEIFLYCRPDDRNPRMSAAEAPLLLTRVCSLWRSIAHTAPRLWSAIHVILPKIGENCFSESHLQANGGLESLCLQDKLDQLGAAVKEWLGRSGVCPLSISLYQGREYRKMFRLHQPIHLVLRAERNQNSHMEFITKAILPYSKRWYDVGFDIWYPIIKKLLESGLTAADMPNVKRLAICVDPLHDTNVFGEKTALKWEDIMPLLSSLPLTSVTLRNLEVSPWYFTRNPRLRLEHVTELDLDVPVALWNAPLEKHLPADFVNNVIRRCPLLRRLTLTIPPITDVGVHWRPTGSTVKLPIELPGNLTYLCISAQQTIKTRDFLGLIQAPSLEHLNIKLFPYGPEKCGIREASGYDILQALLSNCGASLQLLEMQPRNLSSEKEFVKLLQLTPRLASLKLRYGGGRDTLCPSLLPDKNIISDDLLNAFIRPSEINTFQVICPQLKVLVCDPHLFTRVSVRALKEFIRARNFPHDTNIARLHIIRIPVCDAMPPRNMA